MYKYKSEEFSDLNRYNQYLLSEKETLQETIDGYIELIDKLKCKINTIDQILESIGL